MFGKRIAVLAVSLCVSFALGGAADAQIISPAASTTPLSIARVLAEGNSGADVAALQQFLKDLGLFQYPDVTGYFGAITRQAVSAFQRETGVEATGAVGPLTRAAIERVSELFAMIARLRASVAQLSSSAAPRPAIYTGGGGGRVVSARPPAPEPDPEPEPITLANLTLDANEIESGAAEDALVGTLAGTTTGATLSLVASSSGQFKLVGSTIVAGPVPTDFDTASSTTITVRETHPDASNSPKDSVIAITVLDVEESLFDQVLALNPQLFAFASSSYLFQTAATTTPVTADGQTVGNNTNLGTIGGAYINNLAEHRPEYHTENGAEWLDYRSASSTRLHRGTTNALRAAPGATIAVAFKANATGTAIMTPLFVSHAGGVSSARVQLSLMDTGAYALRWRRTDASSISTLSAGTADTDFHVLTGVLDFTGNVSRLRLDGAELTAGTPGTGTFSDTQSLQAVFGAGGETQFFDGRIYGGAIFPEALTSDEIETVEEFLASLE